MEQMNKDTLYVLIHSPLVGGLTWGLVAGEIKQRGLKGIVPVLTDTPDSKEPFWKQHAESVQRALAHIPGSQSITLVGHSGAGPLLPAIHQTLPNLVDAYIFVDASVPRDSATRLDLMKSEDPEWAAQFQEELEQGGRFPNWSSDELREIIPDESLREQLVAEIRPRGLSFFTEPIPVFDGWPDAPCLYVRFSAPYKDPAAQARQVGWRTYELEAGHFHMLVDPATVTDMIV
jgi:pimeloyl-ACP methyl ester carboxylesterase